MTLLSFYKEKQYYLSLKLSKAVRKLITILQEEIDNGKLDQYHLTAHDIKRSIIQYISENTEFFKEINPQIAVIIASSAPNISGAVCCGFLHRWEIHFLLFTERANLEN